MTEQPPPPPGNYPPPQGNYPPPQGNYNYPPPPPGSYPPPPQGGYPPPPQSGYPAGPPGSFPQALPKEAYTPWIKRVAAWFIDWLPAGIISGIGQGIAFGTADNNCTSSGGEYDYGVSCTSNLSAVGVIIYALSSLIVLAYVIWNYGYRQGTTGSTIGKSIMKFKVVSEKTGQPIGFGMSLVRQIAHIVDAIICYIGFLWPLWDAKRQTLADKIVGTVCVPIDANAAELNPQPLPPGPPPRQ
jgi:uncharacterized RDD family membrane protein YckC